MRKYALAALLAAFCSAGALEAQLPNPPPDGAVGAPYSYDFDQIFGPYLSEIPSDIGFYISFTLGSGALPPGLTLVSNTLSGTPTAPGSYTFEVDVTFGYSFDGMSGTEGPFPFPVSVNITGTAGPATSVNPGALTFSLTQGSTAAVTQSAVITNNASTQQTFTASATTGSGGNWLSVSPGAGTLAPGGRNSISVSVDPTGLATGTYLGTISVSVSPGDQQFALSVTATVSGGQNQLAISQSGLRFQTVAGGGNPPAQSITVLNSGSGSLNISISSSTTSGGSWLSATASSTTVSASSSASVKVSINANGLAAGDYYGQVQISANGVANSPQTASVVLNVAAAGTDLGAFVFPTGLVFVSQAGGTTNPPAQTVSITNPSPTTLTFNAGTAFGQATPWFTVTPSSAPVNSTTPVSLSVQPTIAGLDAGIYLGDIVLHFAPDNSTRSIAVLLILLPGAASKTEHAIHATGCTPTKLLPVFTQLGDNFSTVAAWPTPVEVLIVDDCGNFLTSGNVTASFSDGDPSLPLTSLDNGSWSATWQPRNSSAQVVITVDALENAPPIEGTQSIGGALETNPTTPSVNAVVSAAAYAQNQPLAPGAFTSIYGVHLSAGPNPALALPLATQLGGTQVVLGGRPLPLQYAGDGQVNAIVPYDIPTNSTQQLIVTNGPALSMPQQVVIATAQPAVFAHGDGSGVVFDVKPNTSAQIPVDPTHPISAGDAIVIYCAGLGPVNPPVAAGAAAPSSPPAKTTNTVTVTIGGKSAQVFFSGLVGGIAGEYQVNAYVPKGITAASSVPLIVSAAGFSSAPVTVAVK
jgi:uncharacterized protein (TIGR03437 family)